MLRANLTPVAEANVYNDPEAATEVLSAAWDLTLVPLDVTMTNILEEDQRERLATIDHPVMPPLAAMLKHYFGFYTNIFGRPSSAMHDPLAAAVAVDAIKLRLAPMVPVQVDTTNGPGGARRSATCVAVTLAIRLHRVPVAGWCSSLPKISLRTSWLRFSDWRRLSSQCPDSRTIVGSVRVDVAQGQRSLRSAEAMAAQARVVR